MSLDERLLSTLKDINVTLKRIATVLEKESITHSTDCHCADCQGKKPCCSYDWAPAGNCEHGTRQCGVHTHRFIEDPVIAAAKKLGRT